MPCQLVKWVLRAGKYSVFVYKAEAGLNKLVYLKSTGALYVLITHSKWQL